MISEPNLTIGFIVDTVFNCVSYKIDASIKYVK
jgi:hypothetical protein